MREIGYHISNVYPAVVLKEGLRVGSPGFSKTNIIRDMKDNLPLPQIPVYVTKDPYEYYGKFRYEIDISNLKKYPDFGSLPDFGAYMGENSCYWDENTIKDVKNPDMRRFIETNDMEVSYDDITGDDTWEWFGSCVLPGPIPPERIRLFDDPHLKKVANKSPVNVVVSYLRQRIYGIC